MPLVGVAPQRLEGWVYRKAAQCEPCHPGGGGKQGRPVEWGKDVLATLRDKDALERGNAGGNEEARDREGVEVGHDYFQVHLVARIAHEVERGLARESKSDLLRIEADMNPIGRAGVRMEGRGEGGGGPVAAVEVHERG